MRLHILKLFLIALALSGCDKFDQSKKSDLIPESKAIPSVSIKEKSFNIECQNQADSWYKSNIVDIHKDLNEMDAIGAEFYTSKNITACKLVLINNVESYDCIGTNGKVDINNQEALILSKINNFIKVRTKEIDIQENEFKNLYLAKSKLCIS